MKRVLDFDRLKKMYEENYSWKEIECEIGFSADFCKKLLNKNNVPTRPINPKCYEKSKDVISLYESGICIKHICQELNISDKTIKKILNQNNIKLRSKAEQKLIDNHFDTNFFNKIDTEEKAYILGLFYSDGYVTKRESGFELNIRDIDILEKVKKTIGGDFQIKTRKRKYKDTTVEMCNYRMASEIISQQLINLGVFERKSLILQFPGDDIVPDELKKHFIRGYFDGDGSISLYKDGKQIKTLYCGCVSFISKLNDYLCSKNVVNKSSLNFGKDKERRIFCDIEWSGFKNMKSLFHYMYDDAHIYGNRKHNKFLEIFELKGEDICTH